MSIVEQANRIAKMNSIKTKSPSLTEGPNSVLSRNLYKSHITFICEFTCSLNSVSC